MDFEDLCSDILVGQVIDCVVYVEVQVGDLLMIFVGMVYVLGLGLLFYEVQQSSNFIYCIYDWDCLVMVGCFLYFFQSVEVLWFIIVEMCFLIIVVGVQELLCCNYFVFERLVVVDMVLKCDIVGQSFYVLIVICGEVIFWVGKQQWLL